MEIIKYYHRGNNDASEPNTLTAVFTLKLEVDVGNCVVEQPEFYFVSDLGGSRTRKYWLAQTQRVERHRYPEEEKGMSARVSDARDGSECFGWVFVNLDITIDSPAGPGNGDPDAGPIAARFGLAYNGNFTQFEGGPLQAGSEHWSVGLQWHPFVLAILPCSKGTAQGVVGINEGGLTGPAYLIDYKVTVRSCGEIEEADITLRQGAVTLGLGEGGRTEDILQEVQPGDAVPFPPKSPPPEGGTWAVASTGNLAVLI